jgi:hypothetical protein
MQIEEGVNRWIEKGGFIGEARDCTRQNLNEELTEHTYCTENGPKSFIMNYKQKIGAGTTEGNRKEENLLFPNIIFEGEPNIIEEKIQKTSP